MHFHPGSHHILRRYLTPFFSFTLGVIILLALVACNGKAVMTPDLATAVNSAKTDQVTPPALIGTQAHLKNTPTPLPNIPATPDERTPSPLGVAATELQGLQVNVWHPWSGATGVNFQALLDEFNRNNSWGILVKSSGYNGFGGLDDAIESTLTSGALPDVVVDYGYQARAWDELGILADQTHYVDDTVWGLSTDEQADFYSSFWEEDLVTGEVKPESVRLGIPYYRSAYVLFYNRSWAKELGYAEPPTTPEGFRDQACAAAESVAKLGDKSVLGKGGWLITSEPGALAGWIYAFGGDITNPGGADYLFNTPETLQAFTYLKNLQASGCAWLDDSLDAKSEFANRQALFIVGSLFDIPYEQAAFAQAGSSDEWAVIPFPSKTQPIIDTYGPSLLMMRSTPAKQLAAWLVIKWLIYPPNQAEFMQQLEAFPTRLSSVSYLGNVQEKNPQLAQAFGLLPEARGEPTLASWRVMRWALSDVSVQLFDPKFGVDQIPELVGNLDNLAKEVRDQVH